MSSSAERKLFSDQVEEWVHQAPVFRELQDTPLMTQKAPQLARRHYAEVRTFIDLKLPERMRLCPHDAYVAKQFYWNIYQEEQGNFQAGANHAEMLKPFCLAVGVSDVELEEEYQGYWPNYRYLLKEVPSTSALVRELAVSYAWESAIVRIATPLNHVLSSIAKAYNVEADKMAYFVEHVELDQHHANLALDTLMHYVTTESLRSLALDAIHETLIERNPWTLPLCS